jgi:hypothetical protein
LGLTEQEAPAFRFFEVEKVRGFNKYHNKKTVAFGLVFDSKKESERYLELVILQKAGKIKNLERQKRFEIVPKTPGEKAVFYVADFVYEQENKLVCEDVKSPITKKNPAYIIKRKLFKYLYKDYEFRET